MQEESPAPETVQPSEDELREMIAEKAEQKARDQTLLSRKATRIFIGVILGGLLVFVCFPDKPMEPTATPGEGSTNTMDKGDLKFALDLIQYVQPETQPTTPEPTPRDPNLEQHPAPSAGSDQ